MELTDLLFWRARLTLDQCMVQIRHMNIPVSDAKGMLTDLVRRAEHGEDIVLTRHGRAVARLIAIVRRPNQADRRAILNAVRAEAKQKATAGPPAERSQDFLYDENGLPV